MVRGLNDTRREFGLPAVHSDIASWLTRFMKAEPHVINVVGITASAFLMRGRMSSVMPPLPEHATLELRIVRLERGLEVVLSEAERMNQARDKEISQLEAQAKEERNFRASAIERVERQLQQVSTGGVWISLIGTVWLPVGVVLGSIAPEVNGWFGKG